MSSREGSEGWAVSATGLEKSYGRRRVLRGVDLRVPPSSMVAVVGENGAGKSTLLRILAGTLGADAGVVRVAGSIGYCPQVPVLNDNLTVDQHLAYFAAAYRLRSSDRARQLVADLAFGTYRGRVAGDLSGGTRQKLNLTLALMHDPSVLLLDEPYQGFDWETYLHFWELAEELRSQGRAVLVISHLLFDQQRFDALYQLENGQLTQLQIDRTDSQREMKGV